MNKASNKVFVDIIDWKTPNNIKRNLHKTKCACQTENCLAVSALVFPAIVGGLTDLGPRVSFRRHAQLS